MPALFLLLDDLIEQNESSANVFSLKFSYIAPDFIPISWKLYDKCDHAGFRFLLLLWPQSKVKATEWDGMMLISMSGMELFGVEMLE